MISCNEIKDCELETSTDFAIVGFYRFIEDEKAFDTLVFDLIKEKNSDRFYISSTELDEIADDTISIVGLPLNPADTIVTYVFEREGVDHELTLVYTNHLRIYYDECDPVYSYKLDTAYGDQFDSVAIFNRVIDRAVASNVEIYF